MNILSLQNNNNTWFFFPIYGIQIKRNKNWRNFIFSDATIANSIDIREYIKECNLSKYIDIKNLPHDFPDNQTYIVISVDKYFEKNKSKIITDNAVKRSNEIAGLIFFIFLFSSYYHYAITLGSEIYHSSGSSYKYFNSKGNWGENTKNTKGEFIMRLPEINFTFSRNELIKQFKKNPFAILFKIINEQKIPIYKEISNSLVNFYKTSNIPSSHTQQLGSVTSIELLLKTSDKYDEIEKRAKVLLGEKIYEDFIEHKKEKEKRTKVTEHEGVFEKRHSIIHQASYCNNNDAYRSISLYSLILLTYCKTCLEFKSKDEICLYLDLIYKYKFADIFKKHDTFNLLKGYDKFKLSFDNIDWVTRKLINYFGLCEPKQSNMNSDSFIKAIYYLKKIRNLDLKETFSRFQYSIYYYKIPFKNFKEFEIEYNIKLNKLIDEFDEEEIQGFII